MALPTLRRRSGLCLASLLLVSAGVGLSAGGGRDGSKPRDDAPRASIQELIARLRRTRDERVGELRASVDQVVRALDLEIQTKRPAGLAEQREKLAALGPECAPILVEMIDPGEKPDDAAKLRASTIARALADQPSPAVTARLIAIARTGSPDGRLNAVQALGSSPDVERASAVLSEIYRGSEGDLRCASLAGIARLGGPEAETILGSALESGDVALVRTCLQALASAHGSAYASRVLKLVSATREAAGSADAVVAYYRACPEVVDKPHILALVRLAADLGVAAESRGKILDLLPKYGDKFDTEVRKELHQLANSGTREVRESALVTLYVAGDRSVRKELLANYDDQVEKNKQWAQSFEARANILYRIGDYQQAIRDYVKALQLASNVLHAKTEGSHIGLARCYMQQGKLKDAFDELNRAPIGQPELAELAKEPVFQKLAEHPKYGKIFRVE
jgi:tetratricopeptide (TPR) repeat protein